MDSSEDIEALRNAYCPPLDDALFAAILFDYELPRDRDALVQTLDALKDSALDQDSLDFDPSGTGAPDKHAENSHLSGSSHNHDSVSNDFTSATSTLTDLRLNDQDDFSDELQRLSTEDKSEWLQASFPRIAPEVIASVLDYCKGDLNPATDELLNLSFLGGDEDVEASKDNSQPKGVDAFLEPKATRNRQGRKRKKQQTNDSSRASSVGSAFLDSPSNVGNVWQNQMEQVDFICARTNLPHKSVKSMYHNSGARLGPTIRALAQKHSTSYEGLNDLDPITQLHIADLRSEHRDTSDALIYGVLTLARNIPSAADELLEVMNAPDKMDPYPSVGHLNMYPPVRLDDEETTTGRASPTPLKSVGHGNMRQLAAAHGLAASQAFVQASTAYKRGKSDRLMGGAAAYYSSVGHERVRAAKEYQSAAADIHVQGQSSDGVIDLHGVSVADALRIANSQTEAWWNGLGDRKYATGGGGPARAGFRIVTGVGTHSKNHAPRIGPAVSKMLVREGWKIEIGRGEILVTGRARK